MKSDSNLIIEEFKVLANRKDTLFHIRSFKNLIILIFSGKLPKAFLQKKRSLKHPHDSNGSYCSIQDLCAYLGANRATYYNWLTSIKQQDNPDAWTEMGLIKRKRLAIKRCFYEVGQDSSHEDLSNSVSQMDSSLPPISPIEVKRYLAGYKLKKNKRKAAKQVRAEYRYAIFTLEAKHVDIFIMNELTGEVTHKKYASTDYCFYFPDLMKSVLAKEYAYMKPKISRSIRDTVLTKNERNNLLSRPMSSGYAVASNAKRKIKRKKKKKKRKANVRKLKTLPLNYRTYCKLFNVKKIKDLSPEQRLLRRKKLRIRRNIDLLVESQSSEIRSKILSFRKDKQFLPLSFSTPNCSFIEADLLSYIQLRHIFNVEGMPIVRDRSTNKTNYLLFEPPEDFYSKACPPSRGILTKTKLCPDRDIYDYAAFRFYKYGCGTQKIPLSLYEYFQGKIYDRKNVLNSIRESFRD